MHTSCYDAKDGSAAGAEILNVGEDTWLRRTRQMILEREGFAVASVSAQDAFTADYRGARMVILCHTLAAPVRDSLVAFVGAHAPKARILLLERTLGQAPRAGSRVTVAMPDPRGIVLAARAAFQ